MTFREHMKKGLGLNNLGHAYNDIYFLIIPLLLPFLKTEFNLTYAQSGLILTGHLGVRSLFSYISGHLGDKYDKRFIISAGFIISSFFLASLILAGSITSVVVYLLLLAIGVATFHPLATAMAGEDAVPEYRAFHMGIFETTGAIGIILASLTFGLAVQNWGWRQTCLLLSLPGLPLAWAYLKIKKEEVDPLSIAENNVDRFYIILFIIARGIRGLGIGVIMSFLPTYGTDHLGLSAGAASWLMTLFFIGGIFGALGGGWLSDKSSPLLLVWVTTVITVPLTILITYTGNPLIVYILVFIFGIVNSAFFTPQNCWLTMVSTVATRGKVLGAAFLIEGFSNTISPALFGWIADNIGLAGSFRWSVVPVALSLIFFLKLYNLQSRGELSCRKYEELCS